MKRLFDILIAVTGIILFSPLMIFIALCIFIEDRENVFFTQERVGLKNKPFKIVKFRSMRNNEITIVGKLLRKTGLDEIAQFFNVLKGDMSMVGPRPLTYYDIIRLKWDTYEYNDRWQVKPGITGLAQIYAGTGKRVSMFLDRKYVKMQNLWLDFKLVALSFIINLLGKKRIKKYLKKNKIKNRQNMRLAVMK